MTIADIPEYAYALRGRPNEEDMRKHLLYYPVSRPLYRIANWMRLRLGINQDAIALAFPGALYGAISMIPAYFLFLRFMKGRRAAAAATALYAFTYSVWLMASVPETYTLTTLTVNLLLLLLLAGGARTDWRWLCGVIALVALGCLSDLRSFFLLLMPLYLLCRAPGVKRAERVRSILVVTAGTLFLFVACYQIYRYASGQEGFGVYAMCGWLPGYGGRYVAVGRTLELRSAFRSVLTFLVESISPLYPEHMDRGPLAIRWLHLVLAYSLAAVLLLLVFGGYGRIWVRFRSSVCLQALACWLGAYILYNTLYIPGSALTYSPVVVLPLLIILLPGIIDAWSPRRSGLAVISAAVVLVLANNLVVINQARLSWQLPGMVRDPADRLYLLPGEVEQMRFLAGKGVSMLPEEERRRVAALRAKPRHMVTERDRRELRELTDRGLELLPGAGREEALEIARRLRRVAELAERER